MTNSKKLSKLVSPKEKIHRNWCTAKPAKIELTGALYQELEQWRQTQEFVKTRETLIELIIREFLDRHKSS